MDILLSILQDVFKTIASKAVLQVLAVMATAFLLGWLQPWWGRRSSRGKMWVGVGGLVFLAALMLGVYLESRPDRAATPFAILVADLDGDADKTQTHHILQSLRTQFGDAIARSDIEVLSRGEALAIPPGNIKNAEAAITAKGRSWLREQNASVLVWGEVAGRDKLLRLRLLPAEDDGSSKAYALTEQTLELPNDFGGDLGVLFATRTATAISPVYNRSGEALADLIAPFVEKLKPLAEKPPVSFSDETRAQLWNAYAAGEARLGQEHGDNARLASAIAFYKKTLTIWTRDKVPLQWAMTQNDLGPGLSILGERETGKSHLEEAVAAYREALKERTRERVPLDWAMTQTNLGAALSRLGERDGSTVRLEEAVTAFREALKERTRERVPLDWAMTQNNLGVALSRLGERDGSTVRLEEAVTAFREALKERTRQRVPLQWAMTQNNLGVVLQTLGERDNGMARLEEAVTAFREALKEWTRQRVPLQWATTQNNLGSTLSMLGERSGSATRLEEAVAAYRETLKEWTRQRVPLDWAMTQTNLGAALQSLGKRESGTSHLEEAVSAYREALKEQTREGVPLDWAKTQNNLGNALRALGEREAETDRAKGCATLKTAGDHDAAALEEFRRAGASYYVEVAQGNIARLDGVIARLCAAKNAVK